MIKVYVGCALTYAPDAFKKSIIALKTSLKKHNIEVLEFLGQGLEFTPQQVFEYDINCVRSCDVLVANVTYPSLGLGAEFGTAIERKKPIITIAEKDAQVSRFVFGYTDPTHFSLRYESIEEATSFVLERLEEIFPHEKIVKKKKK